MQTVVLQVLELPPPVLIGWFFYNSAGDVVVKMWCLGKVFMCKRKRTLESVAKVAAGGQSKLRAAQEGPNATATVAVWHAVWQLTPVAKHGQV